MFIVQKLLIRRVRATFLARAGHSVDISAVVLEAHGSTPSGLLGFFLRRDLRCLTTHFTGTR